MLGLVVCVLVKPTLMYIHIRLAAGSFISLENMKEKKMSGVYAVTVGSSYVSYVALLEVISWHCK